MATTAAVAQLLPQQRGLHARPGCCSCDAAAAAPLGRAGGAGPASGCWGLRRRRRGEGCRRIGVGIVAVASSSRPGKSSVDGKGGDHPSRKTVWEGEASTAGMWDGWPEGPSCSLVSEDSASISAEEQERLETLYKKARDTYMAGSPLVTDEFFDKMEARLKELDSDVVRKWPRCSVLKRRMYSDIRMDEAQLSALGGLWAVFLFVGGFVALAACFTYFMLEDPILPSTVVAALTVIGLGVGAVAARSLSSVSSGGVLALKGECPSCTEEVYSFLQLAEHKEGEEAKLHCNCHVCGKPLIFQARVASKGPGGLIKVASGRVYLVPTEADFFPTAASDKASSAAR